MGDMVQNPWEKIAENLGLVENSNLLDEVQKQLSADVLVYMHGIMPMADSYYSKVARLKSVTLLQQECTIVVFL